MKITLDGIEYNSDNISEFKILHVDTSRNVYLVCDDVDDGEIFLQIKGSLPKSCRITWLTLKDGKLCPLESYIKLQLEYDLEDLIPSLDESNSEAPIQSRIRRSKIALVNGLTSNVATRQQQKQQQQQQEKPVWERLKQREYVDVVEEHPVVYIISALDLSSLITRDNIQEKLNGFYQQTFPNRPNKPTLHAIWDNLVGLGAELIPDKRKTITGVMLDVMKKIITHYEYFISGIILDNPPVFLNEYGKIDKKITLKQTDDGRQSVLFFENDPLKLSIQNKLTLMVSPCIARPSLDAYKKVCGDDQTEDSFNVLQRNFELSAAKRAFEFVLSKFAQNDRQLISEKIQECFAKTLTIYHYRVLADMLIVAGATGVRLFLKQVSKIKDKSLLDHFWNEPSHYLLWSSKYGLATLKYVSDFNIDEISWWKDLISNHKATGARVDFQEMYDAFDYTRTQIMSLDKRHKLPSSPFPRNLKLNMKAALARVLYIVQHGPLNEQLNHLKDLDYGPLGDYFFSRYEDATIVSSSMRCTPSKAILSPQAGIQKKFSYSMADESTFAEYMNLRKFHTFATQPITPILHQDTVSFFKRYVARRTPWKLFSFDSYIKIADNISQLSSQLTPHDKGCGFSVNTSPITSDSLPYGSVSGYVCVRTAQGDFTELYYIDKNESVKPNKININPDALRSLVSQLFPRDHLTFKIGQLTADQQTIITKITSHVPQKFGHEIVLDEITKSSLLYIVAVASSGRYACSNPSVDPKDELYDFLSKLHNYAIKNTVDVCDVIQKIHESELVSETCPTLGELGKILSVIPRSDAGDPLENITRTFSLIRNYGHEALDICLNYSARKDKFPIEFKLLVESLISVKTEVINRAFDRGNHAQSIGMVLSLLNGELTDLESYKNKVNLFLIEFTKLDPRLQSTLLAQLCDIKIDASMELPTFNNITIIIHRVHDFYEGCDILISPITSQAQDSYVWKYNKLTYISSDGMSKYALDIKLTKAILLTTEIDKDRNRSSLHLTPDDFKRVIKENTKSKIPEPLYKTMDEPKLKLGIENIIKSCINVFIGRGPMEQLTINMVSAFKKFAKEKSFNTVYDIFNERIYDVPSIGGLRQLLQDKAKPILTSIEEFNTEIEKESPNESIILSILDVSDTKLNDLLNIVRGYTGGSAFISVLPGIVKRYISDQETKDDVARFFKTYTLLEFAKTTFNDSFYKPMEDKLASLGLQKEYGLSLMPDSAPLKEGILYLKALSNGDLQYKVINQSQESPIPHIISASDLRGMRIAPLPSALTDADLRSIIQPHLMDILQITSTRGHTFLQNKAFDNYLLKSVSDIDTTIRPVSRALADYSNRMQRLTEFINALIQLRNTDTAEYKQCLDLLLVSFSQIKSDQFIRIVAFISQQKKTSMYSQLKQVFDLYERCPLAIRETKLEQVLVGMGLLCEYKQTLNEDVFQRLYSKSLIHNFNQDTPFPLKSILGFKSPDTENGDAFLDEFTRVISVVDGTHRSDEFISRTTEFITKYPDSADVLIVLLKSVKDAATHIENYFDVLEAIPDNADTIQKWSIFFKALDNDLESEFTPKDVLDIANGLIAHSALLDKIHEALFKYKPYPKKQDFLKYIKETDSQRIDDYLKEYDRHPYGIVNWEKVKINYNTAFVAPVVGGIKRLLNNQYLTEEQQTKLVEQFTYLNGLGQDRALYPCNKRGAPIAINDESGNSLQGVKLKDMSRKTLALLALGLQQEFYEAENESENPLVLSSPEHRTLTLQLLAVMREIYYRTTGKLPHSTQMITLIHALDNPSKQLLGIATGEGKSIIVALFSVFLWAKGGTIDVPTANKYLVEQDYLKKHNNRFMSFFQIASSMFESHDGEFHVGGIHYGATGDLSIHHSKFILDGKSLDKSSDKVRPLSLVADEYDYLKKDPTVFKPTVAAEENTDGINPFVWMYDLFNQFVQSGEFLDTSTASSLDKEQDKELLKRILLSNANTKERIDQVNQVSHKLDSYIDAACSVVGLKENKHFIVSNRDVKGNETEFLSIVPLNETQVTQYGSTFENPSHELKTAQYKGVYGGNFHVDPESISTATQTGSEFIQNHKWNIGVTGTPGTYNDLLEESVCGMHAFEIPPHKAGRRDILPARIVKECDHYQAIINAIKYNQEHEWFLPYDVIALIEHVKALYCKFITMFWQLFGIVVKNQENKQPILVIMEDNIKADKLKDALIKEFGGDTTRIQVITGQESPSERDKMLDKAALPNMITIGTPMLSRGTDISTEHEEGIFCIQTSPDTSSNTRQTMGRASRKGCRGKYLAIYSEKDLSCEIPNIFGFSMGMNHKDREDAIKRKQLQLNAEIAIERKYINDVKAIEDVVLKQFDAWVDLLYGGNGANRKIPDANSKTLESILLRKRGELLDKLKTQWTLRLEASDPNASYTNPYVRTAQNDIESLNNAVKAFKQDAISIWAEFQKNIEKDYIDLSKLNPLETARLKYLKEDALETEFTYGLLKLPIARIDVVRACRVSEKRTKRVVQLASCNDWAALVRDGNRLSEECRLQLLEDHAKKYLDNIYGQSDGLNFINTTRNTITFLERVEPLITKLLSNDNSNENRLDLHSAALEYLELYQRMQLMLGSSESSQIDGSFFKNHSNLISSNEKIKIMYKTNVAKDLASYITKHLAWSKSEAGFYQKELSFGSVMSIVKNLYTAAELVLTSDDDSQKAALQGLHIALNKYQIILEQPSYFAFVGEYFYKLNDVRDVIKQSLSYFDLLVRSEVYSEQEQFASFESGMCQAYLEDFNKELSMLPKEYKDIVDVLSKIQKNNTGLASVDELIYCLKKYQKIHKAPVSKSYWSTFFSITSYDPLQTIMNHLLIAQSKIKPDEHSVDPTKERLFLSKKESSLKQAIGYEVNIEPGPNYFDVWIQDPDANANYQDFLQDPRRSQYVSLLSGLRLELDNHNTLQQQAVNQSSAVTTPIKKKQGIFKSVSSMLFGGASQTPNESSPQASAQFDETTERLTAEINVLTERFNQSKPQFWFRRFDNLGELLDFESIFKSTNSVNSEKSHSLSAVF